MSLLLSVIGLICLIMAPSGDCYCTVIVPQYGWVSDDIVMLDWGQSRHVLQQTKQVLLFLTKESISTKENISSDIWFPNFLHWGKTWVRFRYTETLPNTTNGVQNSWDILYMAEILANLSTLINTGHFVLESYGSLAYKCKRPRTGLLAYILNWFWVNVIYMNI